MPFSASAGNRTKRISPRRGPGQPGAPGRSPAAGLTRRKARLSPFPPDGENCARSPAPRFPAQTLRWFAPEGDGGCVGDIQQNRGRASARPLFCCSLIPQRSPSVICPSSAGEYPPRRTPGTRTPPGPWTAPPPRSAAPAPVRTGWWTAAYSSGSEAAR